MLYGINMPHVNIWIRKEDLDKWNAVGDKPGWIHSNLNKQPISIVVNPPISLGTASAVTQVNPKSHTYSPNTGFPEDPVYVPLEP